MTGPAMSRRRALTLLGGVLLLTASPARAATPRLAAIDWAAFETALALGAVPVAATELRQFRTIAVEPDVPAAVTDLGLRGAPNYELLATIAPELILISNFYESQRPVLERVAPVLSLPIHLPGRRPYDPAEAATRLLGDRLGLPADGLIDAARAEIDACRACLSGLGERPVFIVSLGDSRHFRAFGPDSMFGDVLERLGGRNAWSAVSRYAAAAPVGIEALARVPEAAVVVVEPVPPEARALADGAIWRALPMVREGRVATLPPVNHFGALPSARRFARLFTKAMEQVLRG